MLEKKIKSMKDFPSPLFMVAQLPFNTEETVKLNSPMVPVMDDQGNVNVAVSNLKELGIYSNVKEKKVDFLEIGCGSGYLLEHLYREGQGNYFGIEPIGKEATKARAKMKNIVKEKKLKKKPLELIKNGLLEKVNFGKQKFDYIYSYHVFEHIENPLLMLEFAKKRLKKGGRLIVTCPNVEGYIPQKDLVQWRCTIPSHRWLPGKSTLVRAYEYTGFNVSKVFTYGGYPAPRKWWQEMANKYFKWKGLGDIICIMGSIENEKPST